jgi:hypothetical protein
MNVKCQPIGELHDHRPTPPFLRETHCTAVGVSSQCSKLCQSGPEVHYLLATLTSIQNTELPYSICNMLITRDVPGFVCFLILHSTASRSWHTYTEFFPPPGLGQLVREHSAAFPNISLPHREIFGHDREASVSSPNSPLPHREILGYDREASVASLITSYTSLTLTERSLAMTEKIRSLPWLPPTPL